MSIAILGWGSLIWNPRALPLKSNWLKAGPSLPIEFSRISSNSGLSLVIDPTNGRIVPTRYALSAQADLGDAICDLRAREGTTARYIGFVDLKHGRHRSTIYPNAAGVICDWATDNGLDAVVWTDLPSNFEKRLGVPFSLENAQKYLKGLAKNVARRAREYILNAPAEVDTPLRRELIRTGWLKT